MASYIRLYDEKTDREAVLNLKLRKVDRREVLYVSGKAVKSNLKLLVDTIPEIYVIVHNNAIEGILGLSQDFEEAEGVPFLLVTDKFKEFKFHLAKYGKSVIEMFLTKYPTLTNYVAKENEETIKWLVSLGASISVQDYYFKYNPYYPFKRFIFFKNDTTEEEEKCAHQWQQ